MREAIKILQQALPQLPIGSEPHSKVMAAIQSISKVVPPSAEVPGVQQTALRDLARGGQQNAMLQQVMNSLGGASAGAGGPGGAPQPPGGMPS